MRWIDTLTLRLRSLFRRARVEDELDAELRFHLERQIEENVANGMGLEEARASARRSFGRLTLLKEQCRESLGVRLIDELRQDIRHGSRALLASPGFTAVAVLTLALGIGANTAVFGVLEGFLLRPLPGRDNANLVKLGIRQAGATDWYGLSYLDYRDYRAQAEGVADMAAFANGFVGLSADGRSDRLLVNYLTGNLFSFLGLQPAAGRLFSPGEGETPGADPYVVLGNRFWYRRFGGDPGVIGKAVTINGAPFTVVGVAPKEFLGPGIPIEADAFLPLGMSATNALHADLLQNRGTRNLQVLVRLAAGVGTTEARTSLEVIAARLAHDYPGTNKDISIHLFPERFARPDPNASRGVLLVGSILLALVGLVLLVTCVNIANLVLVRASARFAELALRASLGAGRFRMFRQLLTESLVLAACGGAVGVALGWWLARSISFAGSLPVRLDLTLDWRVFGYAALVVCTSGTLVGLTPAWRASRLNLSGTLREGGRSLVGGHQRLRSALVVVQVAGSLVLLIVAGLFVRSLQSAQRLDVGFNPSGVLILTTDTGQLGYDHARGTAFYRAVKERVRSLPGVESAGFAFDVPMSSITNDSARVWKEGQGGVPDVQVPVAGLNVVDEEYFRAMQIPVRRGRAIGEQDRQDSPHVAVVNETMATLLWPGQDPIGRHFRFNTSDGPLLEVVGLTPTGKYTLIAEPPRPFFYVPLSQHYRGLRVLAVRAAVPPMNLAEAVKREFQALDPDLPVTDVMSMERSLAGPNGFLLYRIGALFASGLGMLGLLLAVMGVYGVIAHSVAQRTHEIGIRMAIGADRRDILRLIVSQGLWPVAIGLGIGLLGAAGFSRVLRSLLLEVSSMDPLTFGAVSALLALVAWVACYIPARRATRVGPLVALRYE